MRLRLIFLALERCELRRLNLRSHDTAHAHLQKAALAEVIWTERVWTGTLKSQLQSRPVDPA